MRSLAEAFLGAETDRVDARGAVQISGAQTPVRARDAAPRTVTPRRAEASGATLPILALRPTGDGTALARALARVLVRRALMEDVTINAVDDCANPRPSG
jgi:hypothetical protein